MCGGMAMDMSEGIYVIFLYGRKAMLFSNPPKLTKHIKGRTGCTVTPQCIIMKCFQKGLHCNKRRVCYSILQVCLTSYVQSSFHTIIELAYFWPATLSHCHGNMRVNKTHVEMFPIH